MVEGHHDSQGGYEIALPPGVELGDYRIQRALGQGGFGITYLAESVSTGEKVVIKENLPGFCAWRNHTSLTVLPTNSQDPQQEYSALLTRFVDEARLLARLNHPNIVKVLSAFEALGTAYYVMPWVGGKELHKAAPDHTIITEAWLLPILRRLLEALEYLHGQNIYHRDVKPGNILLTDAGEPILIDFGTARLIISERSATHIASPGYSPIEQLRTKGKRGPWTDMYSVGATCYRLITGERPPDALDRIEESEDPLRLLAPRAELRGRFSREFLSGVDKALSVRVSGRWQSATEWLAALPQPPAVKAEPQSKRVSASPISVVSPLAAEAAHRKSGVRAVVIALVAIALVAGGVFGAISYTKHLEAEAELRIELARQEAARKAREEAERLAREEAERKAREEAERLAREEAERKAREEAERQAREEAERKQQIEDNFAMGRNYALGENGHTADWAKAAEYYRKAADAGHAEAQYYLGECYEKGLGVSQDHTEAVAWYRKAAEQGNVPAQCNLGWCYENGLGVAQDYKEAVAWYRKAAEQGYARAQHNLGVCYAKGRGVDRDYKEAVAWYRKAAEQGYASAQTNLGVCYSNGQGVDQDYKEAVAWYRKAAEQGNVPAQYNLGLCYRNGRGVDRDYKEAVAWYRKAAEQGYASAQTNLGYCYKKGLGVARDYKEAVRWYRKAAEQGYASAQYNLGVCYVTGQGVDKDNKEAAVWYRKAAEQGNAQAQCILGMCYAEGQGVSQDYKEAASWYRKAAEQGYDKAQQYLGWCYEKGLGVSRSRSEAIKWYRKAAQQGLDGAKDKLRRLGVKP